MLSPARQTASARRGITVAHRAIRSAAAALLTTSLSCSAAVAPPLLGIEHIPVAVADLDVATARFQRLGFTIKPGRFHADGIRNAHAKFGDGSYIELITAPEARDALTASYRRHLSQGDGPAFISLYVRDLTALLPLLAPLGATTDHGTATFSDGPLAIFFFGTRDRSPTDRPPHYRHANSALSLDRIWLAPSDARPTRRMLKALGAQFTPARTCLIRCTRAQVARLPQGAIVLLPAQFQEVRGRPVVGATVRVASLDGVRAALQSGGIAVGSHGVRETTGSIVVPPAIANGLWLEFRADRR